jgi:hypothetical protein
VVGWRGCPIRYMVRVKLPLDLGALRMCWTAQSDSVREDLRVSDEIPKDLRAPDDNRTAVKSAGLQEDSSPCEALMVATLVAWARPRGICHLESNGGARSVIRAY